MRVCRPWSEPDEQLLAKLYPTADLNALARQLGRTQAAIRRHAQEMGVKRPHCGTKGRKYPNRKKPVSAPKQRTAHELYQVCAGWAHA